MPVAVLTLHLHLPACASLKDKRSTIKPILARLHREFNVSTAEVDLQDHWHETVIECAMAGSDRVFLQKALQEVAEYIPRMWPDLPLIREHIETW
jgi:uncharacterized protein YlxP (DUF503 family)